MIPLEVNAQEKYVPKANEELFGTWTDEKNDKSYYRPQKEVISVDGFKRFPNMTDPLPSEEATLKVDSKWIDSEGNIWYKTSGQVTTGVYKGWTFQELDRLSKSGRVFESVFTALGVKGEYKPAFYPKTIGTHDQTYMILYKEGK
jgi:hypothetical protein